MNVIRVVRLLTCCPAMAVAITVLFSGCATEDFLPMNSGILATPGCQISADDNSFTLASGQEFQPPFQIEDKPMNRFFGRYYRSNRLGSDLSGLINLPSEALEDGAKRVRVTVPGRAQPLYGVLALFKISREGAGPGTRSYRIEIPQEYVDAATGGRVSVVYESYQFTRRNCAFPSWVLWLSDQPFEALALPEVKQKHAR